MFDWPEQSHTSPVYTFVNVTSPSSELVTVSTSGPPASPGLKTTFHLPDASAFETYLFLRNVTDIAEPVAAVPETQFFVCCWSTMPFWNNLLIVNVFSILLVYH